ncbi:MAG TPA: heparan-alpha-glucosaminide N-acetyltransferase domain-containing protein [Polyangiaceae bacterium]|nr:heparan-alpha-glucosaminide N-acetyltransferase domain-containing protein [Polyangiaceae bacterium]
MMNHERDLAVSEANLALGSEPDGHAGKAGRVVALRSAATQSGRLVFLDVLRLLAAVQMIQGHSVASVLAPAYRGGRGFAVWTFARGLTSIIFLATAGLSFVLAEARGPHPAARRRRIRRALWLLCLGYLMHAPLGALAAGRFHAALATGSAVDVLQCIGVSLLVLELLTAACPDIAMRIAVAAGLGVACFALAPASAQLELTPATLLPGNYLTARYGSLFPLVPWAGNVLLAFALGSWAFRTRAHARALGVAGALGVGLGALGLWLAPELPRPISPGYCALKLGIVFALAALLARSLRRVEHLPRGLTQLASETLFLYVSHVLILYADGVGLAWQLGERHGPALGLALALALLVLCSAAALALGSLRGRVPGGTRGLSERVAARSRKT